MPVTQLPKGLNSLAIHALRRAMAGSTVEITHWPLNEGSSEQKALSALIRGRYMKTVRSPKGRKTVLVLTQKGEAVRATLMAYDAERAAEHAEAVKEQHVLNLQEAAAPDMYNALGVLLAMRETGHTYPSHPGWTAARAAYKKATPE